MAFGKLSTTVPRGSLTKPDNPEIGRELTAQELTEGTVVVLIGESHPGHAFTVWVKSINQDTVAFWAGDIGVMLVLFRTDNGLVDGKQQKLHVYEWHEVSQNEPT